MRSCRGVGSRANRYACWIMRVSTALTPCFPGGHDTVPARPVPRDSPVWWHWPGAGSAYSPPPSKALSRSRVPPSMPDRTYARSSSFAVARPASALTCARRCLSLRSGGGGWPESAMVMRRPTASAMRSRSSGLPARTVPCRNWFMCFGVMPRCSARATCVVFCSFSRCATIARSSVSQRASPYFAMHQNLPEGLFPVVPPDPVQPCFGGVGDGVLRQRRRLPECLFRFGEEDLAQGEVTGRHPVPEVTEPLRVLQPQGKTPVAVQLLPLDQEPGKVTGMLRCPWMPGTALEAPVLGPRIVQVGRRDLGAGQERLPDQDQVITQRGPHLDQAVREPGQLRRGGIALKCQGEVFPGFVVLLVVPRPYCLPRCQRPGDPDQAGRRCREHAQPVRVGPGMVKAVGTAAGDAGQQDRARDSGHAWSCWPSRYFSHRMAPSSSVNSSSCSAATAPSRIVRNPGPGVMPAAMRWSPVRIPRTAGAAGGELLARASHAVAGFGASGSPRPAWSAPHMMAHCSSAAGASLRASRATACLVGGCIQAMCSRTSGIPCPVTGGGQPIRSRNTAAGPVPAPA